MQQIIDKLKKIEADLERSKVVEQAAGGGGAPTNAQYVTLATDATLTQERVLAPGNGLSGTDAGAGSTYTLDVNVDGSTLEINTDALRQKDGGTTLAKLASDALVAAQTHAASGKTTPVDADELPLADSAASFAIKKLTWANLKATLKTYFDTLYQAAGSYVLATRTISTTAPLAGGGDLSADRTLTVGAASESASGVAELATQTETDAGTDDARIVTPLKLKTTPIDHLKVSKIYESDAGAAALSADATGYLAAAVQPLFSAQKSSATNDVTGDGTNYTVIFDTEITDRNSNYNNSTGVFTAPVTGIYFFNVSVLVINLISSHTDGYIQLITSNRNYRVGRVNPYACSGGNNYNFIGSMMVDMDAGDTAYVQVFVTNGTKTVDVYGAATHMYTYFSAYLLP